jgi:hypothetical protein
MAIATDVLDLGGTVDINETQTWNFNTGTAVASGGFIVVCNWWFGDIPTSLAVSGGGLTWTTDKFAAQVGATGNHVAISSAQAPSGLASATTITSTVSGGGNCQAHLCGGSSFTGVKTTSPVDGTPLGGTLSAVAAWSTGSYAISAGSVIVAVCGNEGTNTGNTPGTAELWDRSSGDGFGGVAVYRIESSAGSYAATGTWGASANNANIAVAYLAAASAGTEKTGAGVVGP